MDITFFYTKFRRDFGKQTLFCERGPDLCDTFGPEKAHQKAYILRNPVHTAVQNTVNQSEHDCNTIRVEMTTSGVNHAEGGWPRDINPADEEATLRYRRRWEKDDTYVRSVMNAAPILDHYINQNNAVELYQSYFSELPPMKPVEESCLSAVSSYQDPCRVRRPIASLAWLPKTAVPAVAVSYCFKIFQRCDEPGLSNDCYVWDLEHQFEPVSTMTPPYPAPSLECHPNDPTNLIAGLTTGQVCVFDTRSGPKPVTVSPPHVSHREVVNAVIYQYSKTMTEFFSGSTDGQVLWWDTRKMTEILEDMMILIHPIPGVPPALTQSSGVSCFQYDRSLPTRFLCGTDVGDIINANKKGKSLSDKISARWLGHYGAVRSVQRNPSFPKIFASCGDWTMRVWADDIHDSCVLSFRPTRHRITDLCWSINRMSMMLTTMSNGVLNCWDLMKNQKDPITSLKVSENSLCKVKPFDDGKMLGLGDAQGNLFLVRLSENLAVAGPDDRLLFGMILEREGKREHILEARTKEIRLKLRQEAEGTGVEEAPREGPTPEQAIRLAEAEFRRGVEDAKRALTQRS